MDTTGNHTDPRSSSSHPVDPAENLNQDEDNSHRFSRHLQLSAAPSPAKSNFKCLFYLVLTKTCDHSFIVDDKCWITGRTSVTCDVFGDFLVVRIASQVNIYIIILYAAFVEEFLRHLTPCACAYRVHHNLVLVVLSFNTNLIHNLHYHLGISVFSL